MILKEKEVIHYFLDESDRITGWEILPKKKRPDLINNPPPLDEMLISLVDEFGNYLFVLQDEEIVKIPTPASQKQLALKEINDYSTIELIEILIKGINNKNDKDFIDLATLFNLAKIKKEKL
jgi:hypothetical protein